MPILIYPNFLGMFDLVTMTWLTRGTPQKQTLSKSTTISNMLSELACAIHLDFILNKAIKNCLEFLKSVRWPELLSVTMIEQRTMMLLCWNWKRRLISKSSPGQWLLSAFRTYPGNTMTRRWPKAPITKIWQPLEGAFLPDICQISKMTILLDSDCPAHPSTSELRSTLQVTVAGWGLLTEGGEAPRKLHEVDLEVDFFDQLW